MSIMTLILLIVFVLKNIYIFLIDIFVLEQKPWPHTPK
jgi:uncharacterized membrane protein